MAWDLTGVRRGTSDDQGCNGLKVQTYGEPGRHGHVPLGGNSTLIPVTLMIGITASFRSRLRSFLGWRPTEREFTISTPWNPRLHMIQSSVPVSSAVHFQTQ